MLAGCDDEDENVTHRMRHSMVRYGTTWHHIQGVFLTGTPPKSSKYKKVNLG